MPNDTRHPLKPPGLWVPARYASHGGQPTRHNAAGLADLAPEIQIAPGYRDVHETEVTVDDLVALLRRFTKLDWLVQLCRLASLTADHRFLHEETLRFLSRSVLPQHHAARVAQFARKIAREDRATCWLFYPRQIAILQELAILYGKDGAPRQMSFPQDAAALGDALFMVQDLSNPTQHDEEANQEHAQSIMTALAYRSHTESIKITAARAFHLFGLQKPSRPANEDARRIGEAFRRATGVDLADHILGGLDLLARDYCKDVNQIAEAWAGMPVPGPSLPEPQNRILAAFYTVRRATLDKLEAEIRRFEDTNDLGSFSVIPLRRYPVVDLGVVGTFVMNLQFLGECLCEGVYRCIETHVLTTCSDAQQRRWALQAVGKAYGNLFQQYVMDILERVCPGRVIPLGVRAARRQTPKMADAMIWFPDGVIVMEVKGRHLKMADRFKIKSVPGICEDLKKIGLDQAVAQLRSTIRLLHDGRLDDLLPQKWEGGAVQPLIVTAEHLPQVWGLNAVYSELRRPLFDIGGYVRALRLLDVSEVEILPDLAGAKDLLCLLREWSADKQRSAMSFTNYLSFTGQSPTPSFMAERFRELLRTLAARFGWELTDGGDIRVATADDHGCPTS